MVKTTTYAQDHDLRSRDDDEGNSLYDDDDSFYDDDDSCYHDEDSTDHVEYKDIDKDISAITLAGLLYDRELLEYNIEKYKQKDISLMTYWLARSGNLKSLKWTINMGYEMKKMMLITSNESRYYLLQYYSRRSTSMAAQSRLSVECGDVVSCSCEW